MSWQSMYLFNLSFIIPILKKLPDFLIIFAISITAVQAEYQETTTDVQLTADKHFISNQAVLDENGEINYRIDITDLPEEIKDNLEIAFYHRSTCDSIGWLNKETAVQIDDKTFEITIKTCPDNTNSSVSLYTRSATEIRSIPAKIASAMLFLGATMGLGQWIGNEGNTINGDFGDFTNKMAASLPVGAVFFAVDDATEEFERLNPVVNGNIFAPLITFTLVITSQKILAGPPPNTGALTVTSAIYLYSLSANAKQLFQFIKQAATESADLLLC